MEAVVAHLHAIPAGYPLDAPAGQDALTKVAQRLGFTVIAAATLHCTHAGQLQHLSDGSPRPAGAAGPAAAPAPL